ncbi:MAG TPA: response regulator transcription factor [Amycolatopsis sp.]|uniref:response regulator transcription factor n=1 Tax=Amycolatopsis sp. TaxID=37632 RepID=UPI002B4681EE|nr:response regulator transcription factor [Amycolatopsis sp.]HKS45835.1 response regulator transcription factor [Amycolatopsis sp.]
MDLTGREPVRVMVADDHPVVRDGVAAQLATSQALRVVGYAGSAAETLAVARELRPDVILLDLRLGGNLAPEIIPDLLRLLPEVKVVLFTAYPEHAGVRAAIAAGAHGILIKDAARSDLVHAVLTVARTGSLPTLVDRGDGEPNQVIAPREYELLRRVALGQSNPEIAEAMDISRNTVKSYLRSVLHKLGARNRVEAIARAREFGLL